MTNLMRGFAATALALSLNLAGAATLPGPLVDAQWLAEHLNEVQVIAVQDDAKAFAGAPEFDTNAKTGKKTLSEVGGHIAGSRLLNMEAVRTERVINGQKVKYMIPEQAAFEKAVQAIGVDAGKPIVLVPVGQQVPDVDEALRVFWEFKVYGEDKVAVLNGGMASWLIEGHPFVGGAPEARTGNWKSEGDRTARYMATSEDVAKAMADKSATLVDSREDKQFYGLVKRDYVYAPGHLEGAKLYPMDLMYKSVGGALKFMSPAAYRGLLAGQGIDPNGAAISYCNSGHLASGTWFVLSEVVGNQQAKLYDGSLHEWTLEKRPVVGAVAAD